MNTYKPRRWPWIAAIVAVVALLVVGGVAWANSQNTPPPAPNADAPPADQPPEENREDIDTPPTGCIAGPTVNIEMLQNTQKLARHSQNGAVDFAASVIRFIGRAPNPSQAEAREFEAFHNLGDAYEKAWSAGVPIQPNIAPAGTPIQATMVGGKWAVDSYSEDEAIVQIAFFYLVDGKREPSVSTVIRTPLRWTDDGWVVHDDGVKNEEMDAAELLETGFPFTGAC